MTLADNPFSERVSTTTSIDVTAQLGNLTYSAKHHFAFSTAETVIDGVGLSSAITISSLSPAKNTLITITDHKSNGVQPQWINDKYVLVDVWIGRIACMQFIFNCDSQSVTTCDLEHYDGEIIRSQKDQFDAANANE